MPKVGKIAGKIFTFIKSNDNLITSFSNGEREIITGMDRFKLTNLAKYGYGIDLSKYMYAVDLYEDCILKAQKDSE